MSSSEGDFLSLRRVFDSYNNSYQRVVNNKRKTNDDGSAIFTRNHKRVGTTSKEVKAAIRKSKLRGDLRRRNLYNGFSVEGYV
jgi:hypothetical protein